MVSKKNKLISKKSPKEAFTNDAFLGSYFKDKKFNSAWKHSLNMPVNNKYRFKAKRFKKKADKTALAARPANFFWDWVFLVYKKR